MRRFLANKVGPLFWTVLAAQLIAQVITYRQASAVVWLIVLIALQACACALGYVLVSRHLARGRAAEAAARAAEAEAREAETVARTSEAAARYAEAAARYAEVASLRAQQDIRDSEDRFRSAFEYAAIGMALVRTDGRWLRVNRALCELVGYTESELLERDFQSITHPDDLQADLDSVRRMLAGEIDTYRLEKRYVRKDGQIVWALLAVSLIRDDSGQPHTFIAQIQDITARKTTEEKLRHESTHDGLTRLPNRVLFRHRLEHALARARRNPEFQFAVLFLDLDRFKVINDSLGHEVGDKLLLTVAEKLRSCLRDTDEVAVPVDREALPAPENEPDPHGRTVARMGGDEFTLLIEDLHGPQDAVRVAERILNAINIRYEIDGHAVITSVSIGIAMGGTHYERADDLVRDADNAMYKAKAAGKARYALFDSAMHEAAVERLHLETDLHHALEKQQFLLEYQPIVCLDDGQIAGFEALLRWRHPERGLLPPADFVHIAEEAGLILPIGGWVIEQACLQLARWQEAQDPVRPPLFISVNLARRQLTDARLAQRVEMILRETRVIPGTLQLELNESMLLTGGQPALDLLRRIQSAGVKLIMGSFGTGYSSLGCLHRLRLDGIKIDRTLISRVEERRDYTAVVQAITGLTRGLGMSIVAEGVETLEHVAMLQALGCEFGQGYYFGAAMPPDEATRFLAQPRRRKLSA